MAITRSANLILLEPRLSNIHFDALQSWQQEWTALVNQRTAQKATVTDYRMTGFGLPRYKAEGATPSFDQPIEGGTKQYTPVKRALAYAITEEAQRHELYGVYDRLEGEVTKSHLYQQEISVALLLNNGFSTTVPSGAEEYSATGFDGLALFSTAHTRLDGGPNQANRPSTDADLGVTSLQAAETQFHLWRNDRGRPVAARPRLLVVHPNDKYVAAELLKSEYKPGTANNDINELANLGLSFTVNHYLTDDDAWFLFGDEHDLNLIWDRKPYSKMWEPTDGSETIHRMQVQSYAVGFGSWVGVYGSRGA